MMRQQIKFRVILVLIAAVPLLLNAQLRRPKYQPPTATSVSPAPPNIIGIQVTNITAASATVKWHTDTPSTSQVVVTSNNGVRYPYEADPALVTDHAVTIPTSPKTAYTLEVLSADATGRLTRSGNPDKADSFTAFTSSDIDMSAPLDFRVDGSGPPRAFAGSSIILRLPVTFLSGKPSDRVLDSVSGLPEGVGFRLICAYNWPEQDPASSEAGCPTWGSLEPSAMITARLYVDSSARPGDYEVTIRMRAGNVVRPYVHHLAILPVPAIIPPTDTGTPPIPKLSEWESTMLSNGKLLCEPLKAYSFGWEADVWYYDGTRVFLQIADYTKDYGAWVPCAVNIAKQYQKYAIESDGYFPSQRYFPHGLAMDYWRFGDAASKQAIEKMHDGMRKWCCLSGYPESIRDTSYALEVMTKYIQLGHKPDYFDQKLADLAVGMAEEIAADFPNSYNQGFMNGMLAEALINWYELTSDARVPYAVKDLLDWFWVHSYSPDEHGMIYNHNLIPQTVYRNNNLLVAPAFAWYWNLTKDDVYRERGDQVFADAFVDGPQILGGKQFSQNYKWSFDYVRWRSGNPVSMTNREYNQSLTVLSDTNALANTSASATVHDQNSIIPSDTTAPAITSVSATVDDQNSIVVSWSTDEPSSGWVEIGRSDQYGQPVQVDALYATDHTIRFFPAGSNTTYHFRIRAWDRSGNLSTSDDRQYTTPDFAAKGGAQTIFHDLPPCEVLRDAGPTGFEAGLRFKSKRSGRITAIRFWKTAADSGTAPRIGRIWSSSGRLLASVTFTGEGLEGWQEQTLDSPLTIAADTEYMVSVNTLSNVYCRVADALSTEVSNGVLVTVVGSNGRYGPVGTYPKSSWGASSYYRDIVFVPDSPN